MEPIDTRSAAEAARAYTRILRRPPVVGHRHQHRRGSACERPDCPAQVPTSALSAVHAATAAVPAVYVASLERVPESAGAARRLVVRALDAWCLPGLTGSVELVVTELVSNAVRHASGAEMRVTVRRVNERRVRVSVFDGDRTRPRVRQPGLDGERGRGLLIVAAEATAWGVDLLPGGKSVWADCTADRAADCTPATTGAGPDRDPGMAGAGAARLPGPDIDVHRSHR